MTLDEFIERLKKLLREAEAAGLDADQVCEVAEFVLGDGWRE